MNKLLTLLVGCVLLFGISNALEFKDCGELFNSECEIDWCLFF